MKITKIIVVFIAFLATGCSVSSGNFTEVVESTPASYVNYQSQISQDLIVYDVDVDASYAIDVTDPENLIDDKAIVIEATVGNIEVADIYGDNQLPETAMDIVSYNVLYGTPSEEITQVYYEGGIVTVSDYVEFNPKSAEKSGLTDLSDEEQKNSYVKFELDSSFEYQVGETYTLIIYRSDDGRYHINTNGYGTFTASTTNSKMSKTVNTLNLKNVLTGKALKLD